MSPIAYGIGSVPSILMKYLRFSIYFKLITWRSPISNMFSSGRKLIIAMNVSRPVNSLRFYITSSNVSSSRSISVISSGSILSTGIREYHLNKLGSYFMMIGPLKLYFIDSVWRYFLSWVPFLKHLMMAIILISWFMSLKTLA